MSLLIEIELDLFHGEPDWWPSAQAVQALLDATTAINAEHLRAHPDVARLYALDAAGRPLHRYVPDPHRARAERFRTGEQVRAEGEGDCDDLAPERAAELQVFDGIDAHPFVFWRRAAEWDPARRAWARALNYHIPVQRPDGVEDPSRRLGMGG